MDLIMGPNRILAKPFILLICFSYVASQSESGPGGFKIGLDGKIYSFNTDTCTGGVFFKKPITPTFICMNGYFLKRSNGCEGGHDEIVSAADYGCIDYAGGYGAAAPPIQLVFAVTNYEFPLEHSVTIYDDKDLLTNFRRYTYMSAVQKKYGGDAEKGGRYVVVSNPHNTPEVNIGKICYDGIPDDGNAYLGDLGVDDFSHGEFLGFFTKECKEASVNFDFDNAKNFSFTDSFPKDFTGEIMADPKTKPKRPLGIEDLEELLSKHAVQTPAPPDSGSGTWESKERTTYSPPTTTPKPPKVKTTTLKPEKSHTSLRDEVQWVKPIIKDPLLETNIKLIQYTIEGLSPKYGKGVNPLDNKPGDDIKWYKILGIAKDIAKKFIHAESAVDPKYFDTVYSTFGYLYRTLPDSYLTDDMIDGNFDRLIPKLEECLNDPFKKSSENPFSKDRKPFTEWNITYSGCPLVFQHIVEDVPCDDDGNPIINKLEEEPRDENRYHPNTNDPMVETMWNALDISFSVCAEYFHDDFGALQRMMTYMEDTVFLKPEVQERWYQNKIAVIEDYQSYLPTDHLVATMRNIDKYKAIAHKYYHYPDWIDKPRLKEVYEENSNALTPTGGLLNAIVKGKLKPEKVHHRRKYPVFKQLLFKRIPKRRRHRMKRYVELDPTVYDFGIEDDGSDNSVDSKRSSPIQEIWDGLAFCLQMNEVVTDGKLYQNGFTPTIEELKSEHLCNQ